MSFLSKRRTQPGPSFDDTLGRPEARELLSRYDNGDWRAAQAFLEPITDWHDRGFYLRLLAARDRFPIEWEQATSDGVATLVRGMFLTFEAWRVRGSDRANNVQQNAWPQFFALLKQAEGCLTAAAERRPTDPQPWAALLPSGMGLQVPKEVLIDRFNEAAARCPGFRPAYNSIVNAVAEKWGGSHAMMFDVARQTAAKLASGSPGYTIIVRAHFLRWQHYYVFEKDDQAAGSYYKMPEVAAEIRAAADRSAFATEFVPGPDWAWGWAELSLALALTGDAYPEDRALAAQLFRSLGDVVPNSTGWNERFGSTVAEQYTRLRNLCYQTEKSGARS